MQQNENYGGVQQLSSAPDEIMFIDEISARCTYHFY